MIKPSARLFLAIGGQLGKLATIAGGTIVLNNGLEPGLITAERKLDVISIFFFRG
jgi:hypothetical protein